MARIFRRIYEFPKPTIAAVNGAAIAGGTGIATMCDFTLAVTEAKFGYASASCRRSSLPFWSGRSDTRSRATCS